mmetsp:Transcript_13950/g.40167  ORF Transcript_13950/g.40167 Transcript_13950/m.40167 type:complete len:227 (+) Transcript_13950:300-980(+)
MARLFASCKPCLRSLSSLSRRRFSAASSGVSSDSLAARAAESLASATLFCCCCCHKSLRPFLRSRVRAVTCLSNSASTRLVSATCLRSSAAESSSMISSRLGGGAGGGGDGSGGEAASSNNSLAASGNSCGGCGFAAGVLGARAAAAVGRLRSCNFFSRSASRDEAAEVRNTRSISRRTRLCPFSGVAPPFTCATVIAALRCWPMLRPTHGAASLAACGRVSAPCP